MTEDHDDNLTEPEPDDQYQTDERISALRTALQNEREREAYIIAFVRRLTGVGLHDPRSAEVLLSDVRTSSRLLLDKLGYLSSDSVEDAPRAPTARGGDYVD